MALSRKQALKRLRGFQPRIVEHLKFIARSPDDQTVPHWKVEARNWLQQMKEVLPYVGKKTAEQWQTLIDSYRDELGD